MRGLPAPLPEGERILWQGGPETRPFLRQIFHTRLALGYIAVTLGWCLLDGVQSGNIAGAATTAAIFTGLAIGAFGIFAVLAYLMARSTTYTVTTRRVVLEYGAAFEKTLQIPFVCIESADVRAHDDGTADIVLSLSAEHAVNYFILWPHVRPWSLMRARPMLRAVPDGMAVAQTLGRAMAALAGVPPQPLADAQQDARPGAVTAAA
jgi:hypothetical protein